MFYFVYRRQPTPPIREPEPEPEAEEQEDNGDLQNRVQKLEEEVQQVSSHKASPVTRHSPSHVNVKCAWGDLNQRLREWKGKASLIENSSSSETPWTGLNFKSVVFHPPKRNNLKLVQIPKCLFEKCLKTTRGF